MRERWVSAAGALALSAAAAAQPAAGRPLQDVPATATPDVAADDSDIIVVARKTRERLQDTPISITAIPRAELERRGIDSLADVAKVTPGLNYGDFGDIKLSPTSLRGVVGSAGSAGADPAVGYYVDEVFVGQGAGANLDLYDIAQIEVLRGPQGTLYGRNTIGGVINITTEKPSETLAASFAGTVANYDRIRLGGSLSGPLVDGLLRAKIALVRDFRDGYDRNIFLNRNVNDHDVWSGRAQLLVTPAPATELLLSIDHAEAHQETLVFETLRYNPKALVPQLLTGAGYALNTDPFDRKVIANSPSTETLHSTGGSAHFRTRLGGIDIVNIAAYRAHDYYSRTDTCRCQLKITYDGDPESVTRFSNEFRISGASGGLKWLAGLYYLDQDTDNQSFIELGADTAAVFGDPSLTGSIIGSTGRLKTISKAVFGSATWAFSDRVDVTLGARYTHDSKRIHYVQTDPLAILGGSATIDAHDSWGRLTPNANIRFRVSPQLMVYVTASKGFKSGGFNDALGDANGIAFGPESLWNYEAGVKAELFDRRLTINTALYAMRWDHIQITTQNPATTFFNPIILNAGRAHSRGIEIEATARIGDRLRVGANLAVQDAKYEEGLLPTGQPLRFIPYAPAYTGDINAQYSLPTALGPLSVQADYHLRGRSYLTTNNDPDGRVAAYGLLDMRLTLAADNDRWRLSLFGKNVTNKTYVTRLFDLYDNTLNGQKLIALGEPRTYGVEYRLNFF